ncbi:MAG: WYL domain-containing protein, partial [Deltaproteobacteria bacterium]|nr:WYL domain-containing protein [Deltaproteobacteria bacterium]
MKKFKPQFTRLLFIDRKIREMAYPNCNSLAREWEGISSRTIARDIEYMRDMLGAPVEFDRLKNGYFYSEGNYSLPAMTINESDLFAIALAKKALEAYRETPLYGKLVGIFEKIGAMLPDKVTIDPSWIDSRVTFLEPPRTKIIPEVWENIAKALREQRVLKIAHKTPSFNEPVNRDAEPYHLVNYHGEWYLVARCRLKKKVLLFAISRISGAEILNERF